MAASSLKPTKQGSNKKRMEACEDALAVEQVFHASIHLVTNLSGGADTLSAPEQHVVVLCWSPALTRHTFKTALRRLCASGGVAVPGLRVDGPPFPPCFAYDHQLMLTGILRVLTVPHGRPLCVDVYMHRGRAFTWENLVGINADTPMLEVLRLVRAASCSATASRSTVHEAVPDLLRLSVGDEVNSGVVLHPSDVHLNFLEFFCSSRTDRSRSRIVLNATWGIENIHVCFSRPV